MLRGGEQPERPQVTLPRLRFLETPPDEIEREAAEAAAKIATQRTIRAGLDAWAAITRAETFEGWKRIGAALAMVVLMSARVAPGRARIAVYSAKSALRRP